MNGQSDRNHFHDLVSIIISAYKMAGLANRVIDNALAQTYNHREILVVNDSRALISGRWKLVRIPIISGVRYQLFERDSDPDCKYDVSDKFEDVFLRLKEMINNSR